MGSKLVKTALFSIVLSVYSAQSFATAKHCNGVEGTKGKVVSVNIGWDDGTDENIAFGYIPNGSSSRTISVKRTVGNSAGYALYQLLLTATLTQSTFHILRCTDDQLSGGEIIND